MNRTRSPVGLNGHGHGTQRLYNLSGILILSHRTTRLRRINESRTLRNPTTVTSLGINTVKYRHNKFTEIMTLIRRTDGENTFLTKGPNI